MKSSILLLMFLLGFRPGGGVPHATNPPDPLEAGFAYMYDLNFHEARHVFLAYIEQHPDDPMGFLWLGASYLFQEFNERGVFTSSFFLNDETLLGGIPDPVGDVNQTMFLKANARARQMAQGLLDTNANDATGLFVMTVANGMQADFDALIAKQRIASLSLLRETKKSATKLLSVDPNADDAYLALGAANYIIGCLPAYKRFFLSFGGIHGDRTLGMRQLQLAAERGHYLRPFAKVMLALAALREKNYELARQLFAELHEQFPANNVFTSELEKLR
jgi:tetratricopeptide (TPR) repeat protein